MKKLYIVGLLFLVQAASADIQEDHAAAANQEAREKLVVEIEEEIAAYSEKYSALSKRLAGLLGKHEMLIKTDTLLEKLCENRKSALWRRSKECLASDHFTMTVKPLLLRDMQVEADQIVSEHKQLDKTEESIGRRVASLI
jgi:hypothetical protein